MSPGNTMLRVYAELKSRIMAAEFQPGERLDPGRLASGLHASRTPVRDALLQLSGERLVDSWEQEGFRVPHVNESAIRDIYEWTNEVLHVVIRAAARRRLGERRGQALSSGDYGQAVASCFIDIATLSPNHEHRAAITNLTDRSAAFRRAEGSALDGVYADVVTIDAAVAIADWAEVGRAIEHFHRRRIRMVAVIAAELRPREPKRG